ncbi:MAG: MlaE family ABC transporter permease [Flavobacteriales bacterium]
MKKFFAQFGAYYIFILTVFSRPQRMSWFRRQLVHEMMSLGINSLTIVTIISLFMGAVITIQTAYNIDSPFIPIYAVGLATRDSIILEFSPTIISLILAGKVGSNIASEIGTMRVTEQIDALEIMGINSASYLVLPKIVAALLINPFLVLLSMFLGIFGGWIFGVFAGSVTTTEYEIGIQYAFKVFYVTYALIKTVFFAFIITSVPAFYGYFTQGGALEVGTSSTKAVVVSSIFILIVNYILTQLLLA